MDNHESLFDGKVLILGGTGFVGRQLVKELSKKKINLRLSVRDPSRASELFSDLNNIEILQGDVIKNEGLSEALKGIDTVYYLIHSMGGKTILKNKEFAKKDKVAAHNLIDSAEKEGVKRVIYLGGLGETGKELSEHLSSRSAVADILSARKVSATILRAAVIIGAGGASFEMLRYLVERLPVMTCPRWINTRIQPIALRDVIKYLSGCLENSDTAGRIFDIGGPEILTYRKMIDQYAEARGMAKRLILTLPFLTPIMSAYWIDLVTPIPSGISHPLIEGLKNEVICKDNSIDNYVKIEKTPFKESVKIAVSEETTGPGVTGF